MNNSNPCSYKESWKKYNLNRRIKVLEKVGPLACNRCGCDRIEFLEINHKNGGGAKEVRHKNQQFYAGILKGDRSTEDLEILCKPCNNIHYLELLHGPLPFRVTWEGTQNGE